MKKGITEFEIDGVKRGFKFGTYAFAIASKEDACALDVLMKRIGIEYEEDGEKKKDDVNLMSLLRVFYGAAVHYMDHKRKPIDFNTSDVSDWLDDLGIEKVNSILSDGLSQYVPKNSPSLAETGEVLQ